MLGCIQPISSPMMKRIFGFCPCAWAGVGMLAIVVALHNATRALQIVLNKLMVAFLFFRPPKPGAAALAHPPPPAHFAFADPRMSMFLSNRSGALRTRDWSKQTGCAMQVRQVAFLSAGHVLCDRSSLPPLAHKLGRLAESA